MENKKIHFILTLIGLIIATQCGHPDDVHPDKPDRVREFTTAFKDDGLANFRNSMETATANGKINTAIFKRVNWNKAYKVENSTEGIITYTLPLLVRKPGEFDNLIIVVNDKGSHPYIIRYKPDDQWLKEKPRRGGFDTYTGILEIVDINNEVMASSTYMNGEPVRSDTGDSGRIETCVTWIDVEWVEVCVVDWGCYIGEMEVTEYEACQTPGGGGGPGGGGPSNGGGIDGGGSPGGGGSPNTGPTPIGSGNPGTIDFVDVSYYLTPLNPSDDLTSPYDGMVAFDDNGVLYTYDASINAWLLPDLLFLADEGFQIEWDNPQFTQDFDGAILSTLTTIALVEPTPIGEVIIAVGFTIWVYTYPISNINTANYDHIDMCQQRWLDCVYSQQKCYDCYRYCETQGYWPTYSHMCP